MSYEAFGNAYEHVLNILEDDTKNYTASDLLYLSDIFYKVNNKEDPQYLLEQRDKAPKPSRVIAAQ